MRISIQATETGFVQSGSGTDNQQRGGGLAYPDEIAINGRIYRLVSDSGEMWGKREIAEYLGISVSRVIQKPWTMPDYGEALRGKPLGTRAYTREEAIEWLSIPERERRRRYRELSEGGSQS